MSVCTGLLLPQSFLCEVHVGDFRVSWHVKGSRAVVCVALVRREGRQVRGGERGKGRRAYALRKVGEG